MLEETAPQETRPGRAKTAEQALLDEARAMSTKLKGINQGRDWD